MISNPARFFINGNNDRQFTYEGGSTLFHWSPNLSGLSSSMESNVIFFANDEDHARDVLRRLFEFWIEHNELYVKSILPERDRYSSRNGEIRVLRDYLNIERAPTNQFYQVGWACNDNLNVYERTNQ